MDIISKFHLKDLHIHLTACLQLEFHLTGFLQVYTVSLEQKLLSMPKCSDINRFAFIKALVWL